MQAPTRDLFLYVNGHRVDVDVQTFHPGRTTLLGFLRSPLGAGLSGAKLACGEGGCGACTVVVQRVLRGPVDRSASTTSTWSIGDDSVREMEGGVAVSTRAVNACLMPLAAAAHCHVITVEGLGANHALPERFRELHASQCGFCTPGFVMAIYAELAAPAGLGASLDGNLCRCTGYRPILDVVQSIACPTGAQRSFQKMDTGSETALAALVAPPKVFDEPTFPPELLRMARDRDSELYRPLVLQPEHALWEAPLDLEGVHHALARHPGARLIGGNTEVGIEAAIKGAPAAAFVYLGNVAELQTITVDGGLLIIGGGVTLHSLAAYLRSMRSTSSTISALLDQLRWFASTQVRNVATVAGNLMTASPASDLYPVLAATGSTIVVSCSGAVTRRIAVKDCFVDYRKVAIENNEVLLRIEVPLAGEDELVTAYKQARRREDDISAVCAGIRGTFDGCRLLSLNMFVGGVASTLVSAPSLCDWVAKTRPELSNQALEHMLDKLAVDVHIPDGAPGGMVAYRNTLPATFLYRFFIAARLTYQGSGTVPANVVSAGVQGIDRGVSSGSQPEAMGKCMNGAHPVSSGVRNVSLEQLELGAPDQGHVGKPVAHVTGKLHANGEAVFLNDEPELIQTLHAYPVTASRAHCNITDIDARVALVMPGVHAFISANDVPGSNTFGVVVQDEPVFPETYVAHHSEIIGLVLARTYDDARDAARKVQVTYSDAEGQAIFTIRQAIEAGSFFEMEHSVIERGNVEERLGFCDHVLENTVSMGGQNHFYLEPQSAVVVPREGGAFDVLSSTQAPTHTQGAVATALGVPNNRVVVRTRRLGGAFGGKETRASKVAAMAAVAASTVGRPVKLVLDRQVDMATTGGRHPFTSKFKVGFTSAGVIKALQVEHYANAGCSVDLSAAVVHAAMFKMDSAYSMPHDVSVRGVMCKTNLPSNTAFRGFGAPQGMFAMETILEAVAATVGRRPEEIRRVHLLPDSGAVTHFDTPIDGDITARRCLDQAMSQANFDARRVSVETFNNCHKHRKRGVAAMPTKFPVAFGPMKYEAFLNKAYALVHIYIDGHVLLTHAGVEMGQGLHTKMIQVAAQTLGVPAQLIHVAETSTDKIANTSPTAASVSSDVNGGAVRDACEQLAKRLQRYRNAQPSASLADLATAAFFDRVNLTAHGFYSTPDLGYVPGDPTSGRPFDYFVYGAAVVEAEIDVLTGEHTLRHVDLVMDLGQSLNPAIDVGQIEGAFVQGHGLFCLEDHVGVDATGMLVSRGPGSYKIPSSHDVPEMMRIRLLEGSSNVRGFMSSKAVGEPPLALGMAAFLAVRDAVAASRLEVGLDKNFILNSPATVERVRMLCPRLQTSAEGSASVPEGESTMPWGT